MIRAGLYCVNGMGIPLVVYNHRLMLGYFAIHELVPVLVLVGVREESG